MIKQYKKLPRALRGAPARADGTPEGINLSQLIDAARCGYRWHLRNRRHIERRIIAPPMDTGSGVHAGIAGAVRMWASRRIPDSPKSVKLIANAIPQGVLGWAKEWKEQRGTLSPETELQLSNTVALSIAIAERAVIEMHLGRWRIVQLAKGLPLVEQKIEWPTPFAIPFYGTPDFVAEDLEEGGLWVWDYKVRERFVSLEDEMFDLQLPTYQYGLKMLGIRTMGSIKFQIRNDVPAEPKRNKDGSMSRQRIATDWPTYERALIRAKLNPKHYEEEMRQKLDVKFFQLDRIYRNDFQVDQTWNEVVVPMAKEHLRRKHFNRVMHTWGCSGCWARDFCLGELRGEDMSFLLQTQYVDTENPADRMTLSPSDVSLV